VRVRLFSTTDSVARSLAADIARTIAAAPRVVLGLPTGRTPVPLYRELVRLHRAGRVDFSGVSTFNLDEFLGLSPSDPRSYRTFMRARLFDHVAIPKSQTHFLNGLARDVDAECARYERAIARAGGIDLQILGVGANGHIGFNEPGPALVARAHRSRLRAATRRANAALFGSASAVPREALSMGMATILGARRIVLMATGAAKARCIERLIRGPVTPMLPASFLQLHQRVEIWLDADAGSRVSRL
jgi:glucosamine-6-phosphate deaminase